MLDDPTAPTIYRVSGEQPFPTAGNPLFPAEIIPRQVTLRDRVTIATIVPFASCEQVPASLWTYLSAQLNKEIEMGDTYPMIEGMPADKFATYWFQNFGAVMILGHIDSAQDVVDGPDWSTQCLGSFYIKPNYPGRSSHVCNAGFLVTDASRNRGVGRLMGEQYLEWAPRLGYTYSVFNLVYETNVASCKIWDALGFKRIGRVPGCGNLKSYPDRFVDAIIYGRDLVSDPLQFVQEERFDKIKFYLKTGSYPAGADRAEKSRLRTAALRYEIVPGTSSQGDDGDKLMLKGREVISDPDAQYEIARSTHNEHSHGGINKTTSIIAERYHWTRIKETVSMVIKHCPECKDGGKPSASKVDSVSKSFVDSSAQGSHSIVTQIDQSPHNFEDPFTDSPSTPLNDHMSTPQHLHPHSYHHSAPLSAVRSLHHPQHSHSHEPQSYIDPQIMSGPSYHSSPSPFSQQHNMSDPSFTEGALQSRRASEQGHDSWNKMLSEAQTHAPPLNHNDGDLDMLLADQDDDVEGVHRIDVDVPSERPPGSS